MRFRLNSKILKTKLLFLTMLIAMLGLAFFSHGNDDSFSSETNSDLVVIEMQEFFDDIEPPLQQDNPLYFSTNSLLFVFIALFLTAVNAHGKVIPRLIFLYHIQPRSPPFQASV